VLALRTNSVFRRKRKLLSRLVGLRPLASTARCKTEATYILSGKADKLRRVTKNQGRELSPLATRAGSQLHNVRPAAKAEPAAGRKLFEAGVKAETGRRLQNIQSRFQDIQK
jgi:hypothetical protein